MAKKPNILFIVTDDQRWDTIHALGNPDIMTPNLDRLVKRGTSFVRAHITGGTCGAVCMPSRAMIVSGRNPFHLDGCGGHVPAEHTTMAEVFRDAGYETIGLGKWHSGVPAYARGFTQGAKIFFGGMWDHWNVPTCRYDPTGKYDNVVNFVVDFFNKNNILRQHCDEFDPGKHSSTLLTDAAIDMLQKNAGGDPWYMYLAYLAPHDPRTMPDAFRKMYDPDKIPLPPNFQETIDTNYPLMIHRDEHLAKYPREEKEVKKHIAEYYAMITHLDYEIGRLLDALRESGEEDNTIVVFTGDNGLAVGQHGWLGKEDIYEHGVRVPLILAGPGIARDAKNDAYVYLYDIYPTLCDMAGLPIPSSVDGKSFACLLDGKHGDKHREELYLIFDKVVRGLKDDRYKLIEYRNGDKTEDSWTFLYDLQTDPWETNNLAKEPGFADLIRDFRRRMLKHRDEWEEQTHDWGKDFWLRFTMEDNL